MKTVCAWCVAEGLAENPPGKVSHSICSAHTLRLTAGLRAAVEREAAAGKMNAAERLDFLAKSTLREVAR